ncbi:MAG: LicD family protein [Mogibacterium sp.]|nr:LicD family protein [Mogibacterium sp.]
MTEVQKVILDIFKITADICERHQIPYFAIGGTCLGAVRHKGFIPWDDDLDIAIPIQFFDKFWEAAEKDLQPPYKTYTCNNVRTYDKIFGKIHNTETAYIEKKEIGYYNAYKGIFVDIMPMSAMPDDAEERETFYTKVLDYKRLNYWRRFPFKVVKSKRKKTKLKWLLMRVAGPYIKVNYYSEKWLDLLRSKPFGSTSTTGYTWSKNIRRYTFPAELFDKTIELPFEDTTIRCPARYDEYLTLQFGDDYMELPPEEKRLPHHTEVVDIHNSYKKYI